MKKNGKILLFIAISISVLIFFLFCGLVGWMLFYAQFNIDRDEQLGVPIYSIEEISGSFELLWMKPDLESTIPSNRSNLTAIDNRLYLITEGQDENALTILSLIAINVNTSQIEWRTDGEFGSEIAHNQQYLFVQNNSGISAYTLDSGKHTWSVKPPGIRGVDHMTATNTDLFITATPDKAFILDAASGTIKNPSDLSSIATSLFLVEDPTIYWQQWPTYLLASDKVSGEVIWKNSFEGGFEKTPIFAEDMIFVVTFGGRLVSINKDSGEIIWSTPKPDSLLFSDRVVSNIAVDDGVLYYLSQDSQLRAVNVIDGSLIDQVSFSPSLLELDEHYNRHRFDVTADNGIVAVHFGDSFQLFVFQVQ
jgi:hypothetical protein